MELLESRCMPSLFASSQGMVYEVSDGAVIRSFTPFESEANSVPLFIAQDENEIIVGAGIGGGPRLSAFLKNDFTHLWSIFLGDPESRTGVSVAAMPGFNNTLSAGDGWTIWLDGDITEQTFDRVADILAPLDIKLTTDYPDDLRPGEYSTVILHDRGNVGWRPTALGTASRVIHNDNLYRPTTAYAPKNWPEVIAHEAVHTIQPLNYPSHSDDPNDLMYSYAAGGTNIPDAEALNAAIIRLQEGWRFGIVLSSTNGTFSFTEKDLTP
jgi:hypothetical protein